MTSTATSILDGLSTSVAVKAPCRTATTANITLSGLQTVGGVALAESDRVLVKDQTTQSQNGIYAASTGSWTRTKDFDGNRDVRNGTLVLVANSSTNIYYRVTTSDPIVIGTSSITFELVSGALTQSSIGAALYPRTAAEISASVTPTNYFYEPYDARRYGATGDGSTDDAAALQRWLNAIPTDGEGYLPAASSYYKTTVALTRTNRLSIRGEGLASRIHYTGSGVALTIDDARFTRFCNWYLTGTSSAAGGVYIKEAQEGFRADAFYCDSFTGASAYAMRISDSWTINISGGALRQSTNCLICDTIDLGAGGIVNSINLRGVDMSEYGNIAVDYQAGNLCNIIGCDFSHSGVGAPVAAVEIGRGLTGSKFVGAVNVLGCWFEGPAAGVRVGRSNTSSATPKDVWVEGNYFGNTGDAVRLYKADRSRVGENQWSSGAVIIDAGVTNTTVNARGVTVTDNATAGQTAYYQYDGLTVNSVVARNDFKIGSGATLTRLLTGSATVDFASVASGATTSAAVTVTGAALGDAVMAVSHTVAVPAGVLLTGNVTAADTVTVTLLNQSGGAVDLASGTVRAYVVRSS